MWKKYLFPVLVVGLIAIAGTPLTMAQEAGTPDGLKVTGSLPALPPPATSGQIPLQAQPIAPQQAPDVNSPANAANQFEHRDSYISIPSILMHQWSPTTEVPPESLISERYLRSQANNAKNVTLKEAVYVALRNNPSLKAVELTPVASTESVRQAWGTFDPNLTSQIDEMKTVLPTTSTLQTGGTGAFVQKFYDWNFGANKVSAITNGTLGITFDNQRAASNSGFAGMNPSYTPTLALSLSQPLLQNFGWQFATLNVDIAESGQKQAQWNYGQSLMDFVQRIGSEYWNVVLSEENLEVARASLKFNADLVRQNAISVKVGTLAPLDL
ncbi:MAG TPA: TolC family protein, partial [Candidatus Binataceae bacterium]